MHATKNAFDMNLLNSVDQEPIIHMLALAHERDSEDFNKFLSDNRLENLVKELSEYKDRRYVVLRNLASHTTNPNDKAKLRQHATRLVDRLRCMADLIENKL